MITHLNDAQKSCYISCKCEPSSQTTVSYLLFSPQRPQQTPDSNLIWWPHSILLGKQKPLDESLESPNIKLQTPATVPIFPFFLLFSGGGAPPQIKAKPCPPHVFLTFHKALLTQPRGERAMRTGNNFLPLSTFKDTAYSSKVAISSH